MSTSDSNLLLPAVLVFLGVTGWWTLPQRVQRDAAVSEISWAQAQRYRRAYRACCVGFALIGVILAALTLSGL